jgi:hypothetical protein
VKSCTIIATSAVPDGRLNESPFRFRFRLDQDLNINSSSSEVASSAMPRFRHIKIKVSMSYHQFPNASLVSSHRQGFYDYFLSSSVIVHAQISEPIA